MLERLGQVHPPTLRLDREESMCIGEDGMEKVNHPNQSPTGCVMNAMCEKEHGIHCGCDRVVCEVKVESLYCVSDPRVSFGFVCSPSNRTFQSEWSPIEIPSHTITLISFHTSPTTLMFISFSSIPVMKDRYHLYPLRYETASSISLIRDTITIPSTHNYHFTT